MSKNEITKGGIVIWANELGIITEAWLNKGNITVPTKAYYGLTPDQFFTKAERLVEKNQCWCCECGKIIDRDSAYHFAGHFCNKCWEEYKKKNSRRCGICGVPLYRCSC